MNKYLQVTCPCGCQCVMTLMQNPKKHRQWNIIKAQKPADPAARAAMEAAIDADQGPPESAVAP